MGSLEVLDIIEVKEPFTLDVPHAIIFILPRLEELKISGNE